MQLKELLRRNFQQYWRLLSYNGVRMAITSERSSAHTGRGGPPAPCLRWQPLARRSRCSPPPPAGGSARAGSPPALAHPLSLPCCPAVAIAFFFGTVLHDQGDNTYTCVRLGGGEGRRAVRMPV